MKNMRLAVLALALVILCFGAAGCAQETATEPVDKLAYIVMNEGYYLLEGKVTVKGEEIVGSQLDEYNTMIFWGNFNNNNITTEEINALGEENIFTGMAQLHGEPTETKYAKYVQVGDVIFTAKAREDGIVTYSAEGIDDIVIWLNADEKNIAWFIEQMRAGNYWLLKKSAGSNEKFDLKIFTTKASTDEPLTKGQSQSKRFRVHWDNYMPNIEKTEKFFTQYGILQGEPILTDAKTWAIADAVSEATQSSFQHYYRVLCYAYQK